MSIIDKMPESLKKELIPVTIEMTPEQRERFKEISDQTAIKLKSLQDAHERADNSDIMYKN